MSFIMHFEEGQLDLVEEYDHLYVIKYLFQLLMLRFLELVIGQECINDQILQHFVLMDQ